MRLGGFRLIGKSITYLIMHRILWITIVIGVVIGFLFQFTGATVPEHSALAYGYGAVKTIVSALWFIWVAVFVMQSLKHERMGLVQSLKKACVNLALAWWYIVWLIFSRMLLTFSLNMPKSYGETLPIILVFICWCLLALQFLCDFFLIPLIADGLTSFRTAMGKTLVYLKSNFFTILAALCAWCIVSLIVLMVFGFCAILLQMALEKIFAVAAVSAVMKILLIQFAAWTTLSLLVIAQSIFYLHLPNQPTK